MNKSVNYKKLMSEIWKEKMFYIRLENLNCFSRWVPETYFHQGSKLVVQFYELGENKETILLEKREYMAKSKQLAYIKFVAEYGNVTPMMVILHKFKEKGGEFYRYKKLDKFESSGAFSTTLFKEYSDKFIMLNGSGNYYNPINQMKHGNK